MESKKPFNYQIIFEKIDEGFEKQDNLADSIRDVNTIQVETEEIQKLSKIVSEISKKEEPGSITFT